jgi:DNA-binding Xre family transcriptional regulator
MILDYNTVVIKTNHRGEPFAVEMPYALYSQLNSIAEAARRYEAERLEARTPRGAYRSSLGEHASSPVDDSPAVSNIKPASATQPEAQRSHVRHPYLLAKHPRSTSSPRRAELEQLFDAPPAPAEQPIEQSAGIIALTVPPDPKPLPRLMAEVPVEVLRLMVEGRTPQAAWRHYRNLTVKDAAELYGCTPNNIYLIDNRGVLNKATRDKLAEAYDCTPEQLIRVDLSDSVAKPAESVKTSKPAQPASEPADTLHLDHEVEYPAKVRAHLEEGKHPVVAWRLSRNMSLADVATQYGCSVDNVRLLERSTNLRERTIKRLCAVFHCAPDQLRIGSNIIVTGRTRAPGAAAAAASSFA